MTSISKYRLNYGKVLKQNNVTFYSRIITDTREWRYYKMLNNMTTPVEEGMFNLETKSERPEIFLRPKEAVNVPFVYVSFRADHTVQPQVKFVVR